MARVKINREILAWTLKDAGASAQQLASVTGRPVATVVAWLPGGDDLPHKGDLKKIAEYLGRPTDFFSLSKPPEKDKSPVNRRAAVIDTNDATPTEKRTVRSIARLQSISRWSVGRTDKEEAVADSTTVRPSGPRVVFPTPPSDPSLYAGMMRDWLSWDTAEQIKATSKARVFRDLRREVEARGVLVFLQDIGKENSRGFSLPDSHVPAIFVNSAFNLASVRSYTLLHELAHLGRRDMSLHHEQDKDAERWCESFAAAFLMPENNLRHYLSKGVVSRVPSHEIRRVSLVSNRYGASWESAALRLYELGLGPYSLVKEVREGEYHEPKDGGFGQPGSSGRTTSVRRLDEYGYEFPRIILGAVEREDISPLDARKYLRVDSFQLREMASILGVSA